MDSDALIVAMARLGDEDAFAVLVQRHQGGLRGLLRHLSGDTELVDDLAQQTFLLAWKDIARLRDVHRFAGWLKRIAINAWLKHQRRHDPLRFGDTLTDELYPNRETVDIGIDIHQALAILSDKERACVVLALVEGMSHSEIASLLALPLGTVKSHIRRGSTRLQQLLEPYQHSRG